MADAGRRPPLERADARSERPGEAAGDRPASVYLYPGELLATAEALVVSTVLGSCVCVCLWDRATRRGGLNHFLLPQSSREEGSACRFGRSAMEILFRKVLELGCDRRSLTARVFGGASQFESSAERVSIGEQNVAAATLFLEEVGVPIVGREVGGRRGRRIVFSIASGDVAVRTL